MQGWIQLAYSVVVLAGLAPAAMLEPVGRKPLTISGILLASFGILAFGFAGTIFQLILLRFITGLSVAFLPA